ncbi:hypothetical protein, partial [Roseiconus lacunae]
TEVQLRTWYHMNRQRNLPRTLDDSRDAGRESAFVADGYDRFISAVESEARKFVEAKYADEWNASGLIRRWKLQRRMDAEISAVVAETMRDVSPDAIF